MEAFRFIRIYLIALAVSVSTYGLSSGEVLINEIDLLNERVEVWNRGNAQNMTGWRLELIHQDYYDRLDTISYTFRPGYVIPADGMVLVIDEDEDDHGPLLYQGAHYDSYYEFALLLYDAADTVVDYMETYGFDQEPPDSSVWTGYGVSRSSVRFMYRNRNDDTDSRTGWSTSTSYAGGTLMNPNQGQTEREYGGRYAGIVINEVAVSYSGMYTYVDHIELWNRGDSLDLTGWTVPLGYGVTYEFPDGYVIAPGRFVTLQRFSPYNDSTLSLGGSRRYAGRFGLYDADSSLVDYFYSYTYLGQTDEGWYGDGPSFGAIGVQRIRIKDTDTPWDWGELDTKTDEGKINPGQEHAAWLHASPAAFTAAPGTQLVQAETLHITNTGLGTLEMTLAADVRSSSGDTATGWSWLTIGRSSGSLDAGEELVVPVTFERTGETAGTYYADIVITHNMRSSDSVYAVPCTLTVAPLKLVSVPDSTEYDTVIVGGSDTAYVPVVNPGTDVTTVDSLVSDNAAFSTAYAVPFTVAPYGTVTVPVVYEPAAAGSHTGGLAVYSDAGSAAMAMAGAAVDGPVLSVSVTEISAAVDSGDTFATSFTLTNTGSGSLNVAGHYDSHPVVINEIRNGTWVEFRNRGPALSLAGWQVKWTQANSLENPEYTATFTIPDTVVIPEDGYFGVTDYEYYSSSTIMYMDGPQFYGWITSYALLDSFGNVIDYFERDIMRSARPAGARWNGEGLTLSNGYLTRMGDRDMDAAADWRCMSDSYLTKGFLNRSQTAGYRAPWLVLSPGIDTVLAAGQSLDVDAVFDARYAPDGYYTERLALANDGARPGEALPVTMSVGAQRYLTVLEDELTFPDAFPLDESYDTLYLHNPGSETVTVTEIDIYYSMFFRSGLTVPATVAAGETLAVPLAFMPDAREYSWADDDVYVRSDAVNDPAIRVWLYGTSSKAVPEITSQAVTQATEDVLYSYPVTAIDAEPLDTVVFSLATAPSGMAIDSVSGVITWIPDNGQAGWNAVAVRASDGVHYGEQVFEIFVTDVNGAPVIVPVGTDTAYTYREYSRFVNVSDEDDPVLSFSFDTAPAGMTVSAAGLIEWTPDSLFRDSSVSVVCRVSDGDTSAADTFSLHVRDLRLLRNDPDTVVCAAEDIGSSGTEYNRFTLFNDGQHGTAVSAVTFSDPAFSLFNAPPFSVYQGGYVNRYIRFRPAAMGTVYATVTVYSDAMDHPVLQFTVMGEGLNTAPRITSAPETTATEDASYRYQLTAEDDEIDTALVFGFVDAPAGMTVDSLGLVTWTPADSQYGDNDVVLTVSDGFLADTQSIVISVTRVNDPPRLLNEPVLDTAYYGQPYTYSIPAVDEEGDSLLYAMESPPTGMRVTAEGDIVWLPPVSTVGTWQMVIYSVTDGNSTVQSSFSLYVGNEERLLSASADTLRFPLTRTGEASRCTLRLVNIGTANTEVSELQFDNSVFRTLVGAPFMVMAGTDETVIIEYTPILQQGETGVMSILSDAVDHPLLTVVLTAPPPVGMEDRTAGPLPRVTVAPNPFGDLLHIAIQTPCRGVSTRVEIFDQSGNTVYVIPETSRPGSATAAQGRRDVSTAVTWDGTGISGKPVKPGLYFYVVETPDGTVSGKIVKR